jgi:hypothetical protein
VRKTFVLLVFALLTILSISGTAQAVSLFIDDFDGSNVNTSVWSATANGGVITVANSKVTLTSPGVSFPNIHTLSNPFPATGDFTFEIQMTYIALTGYGCGLFVNDGSDPPIFQVWGDSAYGISVNLFGANLAAQMHYSYSIGQTLNLKLDYKDGKYTVTANNQILNSQPISSTHRPTSIVLGHATLTSVANTPWTSISVDHVKVYQGLDLAVPEYPLGSFLVIGSTLAAFGLFKFYKKAK